jgi:hypothetical protein
LEFVCFLVGYVLIPLRYNHSKRTPLSAFLFTFSVTRGKGIDRLAAYRSTQ